MKSWKIKLLVPIVLITVGFAAKFILWDFAISTGKRVGNLTKISKKGKIFRTWEGTIDEGSGDKLTSYFSVRNNDLGDELYGYEGKQVIIYYEEHIFGWPWETKYNVTSWKPKDPVVSQVQSNENGEVVDQLSKALFCSMLGSLYKNQELYNKVKDYMKEDNLYLYNQYEKCNE